MAATNTTDPTMSAMRALRDSGLRTVARRDFASSAEAGGSSAGSGPSGVGTPSPVMRPSANGSPSAASWSETPGFTEALFSTAAGVSLGGALDVAWFNPFSDSRLPCPSDWMPEAACAPSPGEAGESKAASSLSRIAANQRSSAWRRASVRPPNSGAMTTASFGGATGGCSSRLGSDAASAPGPKAVFLSRPLELTRRLCTSERLYTREGALELRCESSFLAMLRFRFALGKCHCRPLYPSPHDWHGLALQQCGNLSQKQFEGNAAFLEMRLLGRHHYGVARQRACKPCRFIQRLARHDACEQA